MQSGSIKTIKGTHEEGSGFSSGELIILKDDGDFTQSPIELTQGKKDDGLGSLAQNISTFSNTQHDRDALTREIHHLLHSTSLEDISQIASYLKMHESSLTLNCKHHLNAIGIC